MIERLKNACFFLCERCNDIGRKCSRSLTECTCCHKKPSLLRRAYIGLGGTWKMFHFVMQYRQQLSSIAYEQERYSGGGGTVE